MILLRNSTLRWYFIDATQLCLYTNINECCCFFLLQNTRDLPHIQFLFWCGITVSPQFYHCAMVEQHAFFLDSLCACVWVNRFSFTGRFSIKTYFQLLEHDIEYVWILVKKFPVFSFVQLLNRMYRHVFR